MTTATRRAAALAVAERCWRLGQTGLPARFPLIQFPNAPLLVAFAGSGCATVTRAGTIHDVGRAVFYVGLGVWAWEEVNDGANWFRRLLGGAGFVWIAVQLAGHG
jgi:hypothetical protein